MLKAHGSWLALLVLALPACGGGDDKKVNTGQPAPGNCPPGQYFDGQFCQMQAGAQPGAMPGAAPGAAATAYPTAPAPGAATAAPAPLPVATAAAGTPATPLDPGAASAATQLFAPLAQQNAPGAKPVGSPIAGQFQQGQTLEGQVQMQAGKCYTVIGVGLPPIQNLDIQLAPFMPIAGLPAAVVAQDQTVSPQAIIGEKGACYHSVIPMPMKVIVTVSQGSGVAAVQVYEK
jgi:hypothetical protein